MANIKFSQLPNLATPTDATTIPVVASGTNYNVTGANLKAYVNSGTGNIVAGAVSATGNIVGGNVISLGQITAVGNITGNYFFGNGSQLTGLPATYGNSNVVSLLAAFGSNAVSTTGNVSAGKLIGDGSLITNLPSGNYSNSNVTSLMASFGSNSISTTGNVTATYFNGVATTSNYATTAGNATTAGTASTVTSNSQTSITSVGTLTSLSVTGNINSNASIIAAGNVAGGYILGNGSQLTGIVATSTYGNSNVAAYLPTYTGNITANVVSATGNVTGAYVKGNGSALTGVVTSIVAGAGISVNVSTGAVTITNTGGGAGSSSISNGNSSVSIPIANGNINFNVGNTGSQMVIRDIASPYIGVVVKSGLEIQGGALQLTNGNAQVAFISCSEFYNNYVSQGHASYTGVLGTYTNGTQYSGGGGNIGYSQGLNVDMTALTGPGLIVPRASAVLTRTYTGLAGSIRCVTDSPTNAGRMCYWCTTNTRWQYIDTNAAV